MSKKIKGPSVLLVDEIQCSSGLYAMGDMLETLDNNHVKILRDFQKDVERRGRKITEIELLIAIIEFVAERKAVFINSLFPHEEKSPLERWLEKVVAKPSSKKQEQSPVG